MEFGIFLIAITVIILIAVFIWEFCEIFVERKKRTITCSLCGISSMGEFICENCRKSVKIEMQRLEKNTEKSFLSNYRYYQNTIQSFLNEKDPNLQEYYGIKLIALSDFFKETYGNQKIREQTENLLTDYKSANYQITEEIKSKYKQDIKNIEIEATNHSAFDKPEQANSTDYRNSHDKPYRCSDGDYVRSKAEREIDNFFYANRIWHVYEQEYIDTKTGKRFYPDFYLPDYKLYIEYFGLLEEKYLEKKEEKIEMFNSDFNVRFAFLDQNDDANIEDKLKQICQLYNIPLN